MTYSELGRWRKLAPYVISALCILPWFVVRSGSLAGAKPANDVVVPVIALVVAYLYTGLGLRRPLWKKEVEAHVGKQIREAVLGMLPADLAVTENERKELLDREIFGHLTGVFWEAVDSDEVLRSQKEHFYSNGIVYSTSIDVFLICGFVGLLYEGVALALWRAELAYVGASLIALAVISIAFVMPSRRKRHMALSAEQLRLLRRQHSDFIADRFRQIVVSWRRDRLLGRPR